MHWPWLQWLSCLHVLQWSITETNHRDQWLCFTRSIVHVTLKIIYFHYLTFFSGWKYTYIVLFYLKTDALTVITAIARITVTYNSNVLQWFQWLHVRHVPGHLSELARFRVTQVWIIQTHLCIATVAPKIVVFYNRQNMFIGSKYTEQNMLGFWTQTHLLKRTQISSTPESTQLLQRIWLTNNLFTSNLLTASLHYGLKTQILGV